MLLRDGTSLRRTRRGVVGALALVALSGCGGVSETSTTGSQPIDTSSTTAVPSATDSSGTDARSIEGVFTLITDEGLTKGADCEGPPPYEDLRDGAPVIVKDEAGDEIGRGTLEAGKASEGAFGATTPNCEFPFQVDGLPDVKSYTIAINHVDDQTLTADELEEQGWIVEFGKVSCHGGGDGCWQGL